MNREPSPRAFQPTRTLLGLLFLWMTVFATTSCALWDAPDESSSAVQQDHAEVVVLVHGLGRTEISMVALGWTLERQGYEIVNWGYSSTCCALEEIGQQLANDLHELEGPRPEKIHFIGHSLGNIVVRWMLANDPPAEAGRVVMLAPPNQGSKSADQYAGYLGWLLVPLDDLMTAEASSVRSLRSITDRDVGIIAGEYDGKVSVDETRLDTAKDHLVVPSSHTFIMNRSDVQRQTIAFLKEGRFL